MKNEKILEVLTIYEEKLNSLTIVGGTITHDEYNDGDLGQTLNHLRSMIPKCDVLYLLVIETKYFVG